MMKKTRKNVLKLLTAGFASCVIAGVGMGISGVSANAQAEYLQGVDSFTYITGAGVRYGADSTASGIRFGCEMEKTQYENLGTNGYSNVKFGIFVAAEQYASQLPLTKENLFTNNQGYYWDTYENGEWQETTEDTSGKVEIVHFVSEELTQDVLYDENKVVFYGSIVDIYDGTSATSQQVNNLTLDYHFVTYISFTYGGVDYVEVFDDTNATDGQDTVRCMAEVARTAIDKVDNKGENATTEETAMKGFLQTAYIDKVNETVVETEDSAEIDVFETETVTLPALSLPSWMDATWELNDETVTESTIDVSKLTGEYTLTATATSQYTKKSYTAYTATYNFTDSFADKVTAVGVDYTTANMLKGDETVDLADKMTTAGVAVDGNALSDYDLEYTYLVEWGRPSGNINDGNQGYAFSTQGDGSTAYGAYLGLKTNAVDVPDTLLTVNDGTLSGANAEVGFYRVTVSVVRPAGNVQVYQTLVDYDVTDSSGNAVYVWYPLDREHWQQATVMDQYVGLSHNGNWGNRSNGVSVFQPNYTTANLDGVEGNESYIAVSGFDKTLTMFQVMPVHTRAYYETLSADGYTMSMSLYADSDSTTNQNFQFAYHLESKTVANYDLQYRISNTTKAFANKTFYQLNYPLDSIVRKATATSCLTSAGATTVLTEGQAIWDLMYNWAEVLGDSYDNGTTAVESPCRFRSLFYSIKVAAGTCYLGGLTLTK